MEIRRTVLKQPIRIEYLIKQKPRGALAEKLVLTKGSHRRRKRRRRRNIFLKTITVLQLDEICTYITKSELI